MKTCKQCGRQLPRENFRPTKSRGKGIRKSNPGCSTICRFCESMNVQAYNIVKKLNAGEPVDEAKLEAMRKHYRNLVDSGRSIITKAARDLLYANGGFVPLDSTPKELIVPIDVLYEHITKVKGRLYSSFDEADDKHRQLVDALKEAHLYEEVNNMMDRWFEEDDN